VVVRVDPLGDRLRAGPEPPVRHPVERELLGRGFVGERLTFVVEFGYRALAFAREPTGGRIFTFSVDSPGLSEAEGFAMFGEATTERT